MNEIVSRKKYKGLVYKFLVSSLLLLIVFFLKQIIVQYQIVQDNNSSYIMNISGRQRMLSQKITKDLLLIKHQNDLSTREYYLNDLQESLDLWEKSHTELLNLNETEDFLNQDIRVLEKMFQELDSSFTNILDTSELLVAKIQETGMAYEGLDKDINNVIDSERVFLSQMEKIVSRYDYNAKSWLKKIQITHMLLFTLLLCIGVYIIVMIFIPLIQYLKDAFRCANESNKNLMGMLNALKGALFVVKRDGEILFMNGDAERIVTIPNAHSEKTLISEQVKWVNLNILDVIGTIRPDDSRMEDVEVQVESDDGSIRTVVMSATPCRYNEVDAVTISLYDITAQKEAEIALRNIAIKDELTGMYNRHFLDNIIDEEIERAERYELSLSGIMIDLDYFKKVNDEWGHPVGDSVLKFTAKIIRNKIRMSDYAIRIGGEELLILMPNTDLKGAAIAAEKIRKAIEEFKHPIVGRCTVSIGIAERNAEERYQDFYSRMDEALYQAKNNGRNCVVEAKKYGGEKPTTVLKWEEGWNCGEKTIDLQHKKLLDMVSHLAKRTYMKEEKEVVVNEIEKIIDHVKEHFEYEEKALVRVQYKKTEEHKKIHNDLIERAQEIKKAVILDKIEGINACAYLLDEVIVGHLLTEDINFFSCFGGNYVHTTI